MRQNYQWESRYGYVFYSVDWQDSLTLSLAQPLFKYVDEPPSQTLLDWSSEFEEIWGVRIQDLCPRPPDYRQQLSAQVAPPPPPPAARIHPSVIPTGPTALVPRGPDPNSSLAVQPQNYIPQGRSPLDPRIHSQPSQPSSHPEGRGHQVGHTDPREKEARNDASIDPALQAVPNPRMHVTSQLPPPSAPLPSLPSLKASGLLDWQHPGSGQAPVAPPGPPPASNWQSPTQHLPRQTVRDPVRSPNVQPPPPQQPDMSRPYAPLAPSASGMPVGLQWLAHESSVPRQS
jgi:hypothetical protein